jgi:hypothetical protein
LASLQGTPEQQLIHLNTHWGRQYVFTAPESPPGPWKATAKFGDGDKLEAGTAQELLGKIRGHYQANRPRG